MRKLILLMLKALLLISALLLFSSAHATNYYVKNGGSDGAAGTSDGTAWSSINKVNGFTFSAGDTIFFRRGDTFSGYTLSPTGVSSATHARRIVFDAYGTGAKPTISCSGLAACISPNGTPHLVFRNLRTLYGTNGVFMSSSTHTVFDSCQIGWLCTSKQGLLEYYASTKSDSCEVKFCIFDSGDRTLSTSEEGNGIQDGIKLQGSSYWYIHHNIFRNWGHGTIEIYASASSGTLQGTEIAYNDMSSPDIDYDRALCIVTTPPGKNRRHKIHHNYFHNFPCKSQIAGSYHEIYYNIFDSVTARQREVWNPVSGNIWEGFLMELDAYGDSLCYNKIYNNIFSNGRDGGVRWSLTGAQPFVGNELKNNIFYNNGYNANSPSQRDGDTYQNSFFWYTTGSGSGANTIQNNMFWYDKITGARDSSNQIIYREAEGSYTAGAHISAATLNTKNGTSGDVISGNVSKVPVLQSDFKVLSNSWAVDHGISVGLTTDYFGNAVPYNSIPDIGVYEYGSSPHAPITYHVTINGATGNTGLDSAHAWTMARAVDINAAVHPVAGDTVIIHGGVYGPSHYNVTVAGDASGYVTYRAAAGQRPVFQGDNNDIFTLNGQYVTLMGLEIYCPTTGVTAEGSGVTMYNGYQRVINCFIHDSPRMNITMSNTWGSEVYGNVMTYGGSLPSYTNAQGVGYGMYFRTPSTYRTAGNKIENNLILFSYAAGLHGYSSDQDIDYFKIRDNTVSNPGWLWRGTYFEWPIKLSENGLDFTADYDSVSGNSFHVSREKDANSGASYLGDAGYPTDHLYYRYNMNTGSALNITGTNQSVGNNWQYLSGDSYPSRDSVVVKSNKYETGRANVTVYNWSLAATQAIPVTGILTNGQQWRLMDALNFTGTPVDTGTYAGGGTITARMNSVQMPHAPIVTTANHSLGTIFNPSPRFGTFVLLAGATTATPGPPDPPVSTAALSITTTSFQANWEASVGATGYYLFVSTSSGFGTRIAGYDSLACNPPSQLVTGLAAGTTYYYRVKAANSYGVSSNSSTITTATLCVAPTLPVASNTSANGFRLTWGAVTGADSYRLDVSASSGFPSPTDKVIAGLTDSTGSLAAATTYYFRLRAHNASGSSANSATGSQLTLTLAPTATAATSIVQTSFTANWGAVTGASSYRIDVSADTFKTYQGAYQNFPASQGMTVTGLTQNTKYQYRVRSLNATGSSVNSNTIYLTTLPNIPSPPVVTLSTNLTSSSYQQNWNASIGAVSYRLDVATDTGFVNKLAGYNDLPVALTSYTVTGLSPNTIYYGRARAVNTGGTSGNSNRLATTTLIVPPSVPTALNPTFIDTVSFRANWGAASGATSYRLDVASDVNFSGILTDWNNVTVAGLYQVVTPVDSNTTFWYRVRAVNSAGTSPNSNTKSVTTLRPPGPVTPPVSTGRTWIISKERVR